MASIAHRCARQSACRFPALPPADPTACPSFGSTRLRWLHQVVGWAKPPRGQRPAQRRSEGVFDLLEFPVGGDRLAGAQHLPIALDHDGVHAERDGAIQKDRNFNADFRSIAG